MHNRRQNAKVAVRSASQGRNHLIRVKRHHLPANRLVNKGHYVTYRFGFARPDSQQFASRDHSVAIHCDIDLIHPCHCKLHLTRDQIVDELFLVYRIAVAMVPDEPVTD